MVSGSFGVGGEEGEGLFPHRGCPNSHKVDLARRRRRLLSCSFGVPARSQGEPCRRVAGTGRGVGRTTTTNSKPRLPHRMVGEGERDGHLFSCARGHEEKKVSFSGDGQLWGHVGSAREELDESRTNGRRQYTKQTPRKHHTRLLPRELGLVICLTMRCLFVGQYVDCPYYPLGGPPSDLSGRADGIEIYRRWRAMAGSGW